MKSKIVNIEKYKEENEYIPDKFELSDVITYSEEIEDYLNSLYFLAESNPKYYDFCEGEQINLLVNIFNSFVGIFENEREEFDESSIWCNKIMLYVLKKLCKLCGKEEKEVYTLEDFGIYINILTNNINYYYVVSEEKQITDKEALEKQIQILSKVYDIYFKTLFMVYEEFDYSKEHNRILYNYLTSMYRIVDDFTDIDVLKENFDKNILMFEKKEEK